MSTTLNSIASKVMAFTKPTEVWLTQETFEKLREEAFEFNLNKFQRLEMIFAHYLIEFSLAEGILHAIVDGIPIETSLNVTLILNESGEIFQKETEQKKMECVVF